MLQLLLLIPIIGSLFILLIQENTKEDILKIKNLSIITSLINLLLSIIIWTQFDSSSTDYQFVYEFTQLCFCNFNI